MNPKHGTQKVMEDPVTGRKLDRLIESYLADPGSLCLEEQREIYQHFLERMKEAKKPEAEKFNEAIEAVNQALEQARQGDPAYLMTSKGTYRRQAHDMRSVPLNQVIPSLDNRDLFKDMEGEDFEQLKCSIQEVGIIEPIIVDHEMNVICGHQRLRAARAIGLQSVPVAVRWIGEDETRAIMAIEENIRRRHLQPSEMARAVKKLIQLKDKKSKAGEVAGEVGLSERQVYRYQDLNNLIPDISSLLDGGKLSQRVALQISQLDEAVQQELYQALKDRMAKALEEQKAVEFETIHAGLLRELDDLSIEVKKITQREAEIKTKLNEMQDRADRAEFKVGDELKARKALEEELQKTRADMYQKVQEKQALIDKLTNNMESKVVPPPDYQTLKAEHVKLKETLKGLQSSIDKNPEIIFTELQDLLTHRLFPIDLKFLKGKLSPQLKEQLQPIIQKLEAWVSHLKQLVHEPVQEKKRS